MSGDKPGLAAPSAVMNELNVTVAGRGSVRVEVEVRIGQFRNLLGRLQPPGALSGQTQKVLRRELEEAFARLMADMFAEEG